MHKTAMNIQNIYAFLNARLQGFSLPLMRKKDEKRAKNGRFDQKIGANQGKIANFAKDEFFCKKHLTF